MNLLLLSSSRAHHSEYMAPNAAWLSQWLSGISTVLFIPFAAVSLSYDAYTDTVQTALRPYGVKVVGLHQCANYHDAIASAELVLVGGGNTFHLLYSLYQHDLLPSIRHAVQAGTPYIGWSAGANIAGLSICTTNDMPIIQPPSFTSLALLPIQLNPHYTDIVPVGFHGETRDMRLAEFMRLQPTTPIVCLPEGTALEVIGHVSTPDFSVVYRMSELAKSDQAPKGYRCIGGQKFALADGEQLAPLLNL